MNYFIALNFKGDPKRLDNTSHVGTNCGNDAQENFRLRNFVAEEGFGWYGVNDLSTLIVM